MPVPPSSPFCAGAAGGYAIRDIELSDSNGEPRTVDAFEHALRTAPRDTGPGQDGRQCEYWQAFGPTGPGSARRLVEVIPRSLLTITLPSLGRIRSPI